MCLTFYKDMNVSHILQCYIVLSMIATAIRKSRIIPFPRRLAKILLGSHAFAALRESLCIFIFFCELSFDCMIPNKITKNCLEFLPTSGFAIVFQKMFIARTYPIIPQAKHLKLGRSFM